jgi:hypothetical protein
LKRRKIEGVRRVTAWRHRTQVLSKVAIYLANRWFAAIHTRIFFQNWLFFWVRAHRRLGNCLKRGELGGTFVDGNES